MDCKTSSWVWFRGNGRPKVSSFKLRYLEFTGIFNRSSRDAEDAVRGLDGTRIAGTRVRVEMSNGKQRERGGRGGDRGRGR